jgi:hypothetical protein
MLFGTTFTFLERFGLTSLGDLPPLSSEAAALAARTALEEVGKQLPPAPPEASPAPETEAPELVPPEPADAG